MILRLAAALLFLLLLLSACPSGLVAQDSTEAASPPSSEGLPRTIAVLPFQNDTEEEAIAEKVRKVFYNHISSKPYTDVELTVVDRKMVEIEKSTGKKIGDISPAAVCAALGCEGLVYGKVTSFRKVFAAVYSQLNVGAEVWMIDTKSGKEVFRVADSVSYHGGSIPMSPLGALMSAVSAAINLRDIQQVRIINELCYKLNEKIPAPEGIAVQVQPLIREVLTNSAEGPFRQGKTITVGLEGDKGLVATFDIGNFRKGLPMNEVKPGLYTGQYLVLPGDATHHMPILVSLRKPGGLESQWIDPSGLVTIDTTPPPKVTGLKARGTGDKVTLTWNEVRDTPDLKGYEVLRSDKPLTGFSVVGETEHPRFEDVSALPGVTYHYRVLAVDMAANRSEPPDGTTGRRSREEPEELSGVLREDATLSGLYRLNGTLRVPRGLVLALGPGTVVECGEGSSLVVEGTILTLSGDGPVEFVPVKGAPWKGITVEKGEAHLKDLKVKGAAEALRFSEARGLLEGATLVENDTAILVTGASPFMVKGCHVASNRVGFHLQKTNVRVTDNTVTRNKTGMILQESSGEVRENTIMDNDRNGVAATPARLDLNYFGSIVAGEMRLEGVAVSKVYDGKPGQGKVVDVVVDPFASMTAEARKEAASRLLTEGQDYFTRRNYGRATMVLEESMRASPTPEAYYYLALSHQEMKEVEKALYYLEKGMERFPRDTRLGKALAMAHYERGDEEKARPLFENLLRMNPNDRQVRFLLERMKKP